MSSLKLVRVGGNRPLATVDLQTGLLYVNAQQWDALPAYVRRFVELHELAHWQTKNDDELLADQLAFSSYTTEGYGPAQAVEALRYVLHGLNNDLTRLRLAFMARRAAHATI